MKEIFNCPSCKNHKWKSIEKYTYLRNDLTTTKHTRHSNLIRKLNIVGRALFFARPRKSIIHYDALSPYQKLRREVLFNVWFKQNDKVQLNSIHCTTCGFACYCPRPDDHDITMKYEYLKKYEPDQGGQSGQSLHAKILDSKRAARIYNQCMQYMPKKELYILDYGGGNGKLMIPFLENKHNCHIIDYNDNPLPGVLKIGNNINNFQTDVKYDLIICSHVLEHVSNVSNLIIKLKNLLSREGIIYAEVPQEIWAGLRIDADPVTHINYFTMNSFANLFLSNGFEIIEKKQQISNYSETYMEVVWILAKRNDIIMHSLLASDINKMLYPSRLYSLMKIFRLLILPTFAKHLKR